jgi:N-acetylglutamate synthase-like GNAT family acetyltransferase
VTSPAFAVRPARPDERAPIEGLLEQSGLTRAGLGDPQCALWVAVAGAELVGVAGLERYGRVGLVRSVAARGDWRGRGVAQALCREVFAAAAAAGVSRLYLLTETAEEYFRRLGFVPVSRADADPLLAGSAEFQSGHCASAVLMLRAAS